MFSLQLRGCLFAALLAVALPATAQDATESAADPYARPYDGIQASADAHAYWEARRVDAINRQIGWNDLFRTRAALASSGTIFYQPYVPGRFGFYDDWAFTRGPLFGYGFYDPVPQPIGRKEIQTGPNRWESFPIYAEDVIESPPPVATEVPAPAALPPKPATAVPPVRGREF